MLGALDFALWFCFASTTWAGTRTSCTTWGIAALSSSRPSNDCNTGRTLRFRLERLSVVMGSSRCVKSVTRSWSRAVMIPPRECVEQPRDRRLSRRPHRMDEAETSQAHQVTQKKSRGSPREGQRHPRKARVGKVGTTSWAAKLGSVLRTIRSTPDRSRSRMSFSQSSVGPRLLRTLPKDVRVRHGVGKQFLGSGLPARPRIQSSYRASLPGRPVDRFHQVMPGLSRLGIDARGCCPIAAVNRRTIRREHNRCHEVELSLRGGPQQTSCRDVP